MEEAEKSEGVSKEVESMLCGLCNETEGEDGKVEDDEEITPDDFFWSDRLYQYAYQRSRRAC